MNIRSCKAKGRRAAQEAADTLIITGNLPHDDITVTSASVTGPDLNLSTAALRIFPYVFEVKNVEKLNFWDALKQAESHARPGLEPVLIFRRNNMKLRCIVDFEYFCELSQRANAPELS